MIPPAIAIRLLGGVAGLALIAGGIMIHGHAIKDTHDAGYREGQAAERAAHDAAQAQADTQAQAHVAKTEAAQATISKEQVNALHRTNADIDARADAIRVRHDTAARSRGGAPGDLPRPGSPAGGACEAAPADGLSWSVAYPLMLQAEKNQAQLNAILDHEAQQNALAASHAAP